MYPFSIDVTTKKKEFTITVAAVVGNSDSLPADGVPLKIGLNARSSSPSYTPWQTTKFQLNEGKQFVVTATKQSDQDGWEVTLSYRNNQDSPPLVTLKNQAEEVLQQPDPFYLSLNNLNRYEVKVQVEMEGKGPTERVLQPPLQIYKIVNPDTQKPDLTSGNTLIGTQAASSPTTTTQLGI